MLRDDIGRVARRAHEAVGIGSHLIAFYPREIHGHSRMSSCSTRQVGFSSDSSYKRRSNTVSADYRIIEEEGIIRGIAEPLQFYTGRDRLVYEVVIFTFEKNKVTGYLGNQNRQAPFNSEMVVARALVLALPECGLALSCKS